MFLIRALAVGITLLFVSRLPAVRRFLDNRLSPIEDRLFGPRAGRDIRQAGRDVRHDIEQTFDTDLR
jgi:hypothetical protein